MGSDLSISPIGDFDFPQPVFPPEDCNCSLNFSANCGKNQLMAAMLERFFLSDNIDLEQSRSCPMLRCQRPFSNARSMLLHLKHCEKVTEGEIWCQCCFKARNIKRSFSQKVGHCMNHIIKRGRSQTKLTMPEDHFTMASRPSSPTKPSPESRQEVMGDQPLFSTWTNLEMPGGSVAWEMDAGFDTNSGTRPGASCESRGVDQSVPTSHAISGSQGLIGSSQYDSSAPDATLLYTQRKESSKTLPRLQTNTNQEFSPMTDPIEFTESPSTTSDDSYECVQPSPQSFQYLRHGSAVSKPSFSSEASYSHHVGPEFAQNSYGARIYGTGFSGATQESLAVAAESSPPPAYDPSKSLPGPFAAFQAASYPRTLVPIAAEIEVVSSPADTDGCAEMHESLSDQQMERRFDVKGSGRPGKPGELECPYCGFKPRKTAGSNDPKRRRNLDRHIKRMHNKVKETICSCGSKYRRRDNMQKHARLKDCPID